MKIEMRDGGPTKANKKAEAPDKVMEEVEVVDVVKFLTKLFFITYYFLKLNKM